MLIEVKNKQASASFLPEAGGLLTDLTLRGQDGDVLSLLRAKRIPHLQEGDLNKQTDIRNWPSYGSPLLFPFAGRVWHQGQVGKYFYLGREWQMPIHGLAYLRPWKIRQQEENVVTLVLEDDPETRSLFPYHFLLEARYELLESALNIKIRVENRGLLKELLLGSASEKKFLDDPSMPLNLGLHPFFQIRETITNHNQTKSRSPVDEKTKFDLKLCLSSGAEEQIRWHQVAGGQSGVVLSAAEVKAKLSSKFPRDEDAILVGAGSELGLEILRNDSVQKPYLLSFSADKKFSTWVLHSRFEDNFVCVEPWYGPPNNIETKNGLQLLPAGASLESIFRITLIKRP